MIQNIEVIDVAFMLNNTLFAEKVSTLHDLSFQNKTTGACFTRKYYFILLFI